MKKPLPFGLELVIGFLAIIGIVAFIGGLFQGINAIIIGSIEAIIVLLLIFGINERDNIAKKGTEVFSVVMIIFIILSVTVLGNEFNISRIIRILIYMVVIFYMNTKEVKEVFLTI